MASLFLLEHLVCLLGEPDEASAEVLHPGIRVVVWSVVVLITMQL